MSDAKKDKEGDGCKCGMHGRVTCPACKGQRAVKIEIGVLGLTDRGVGKDETTECLICRGTGTLGDNEVAYMYYALSREAERVQRVVGDIFRQKG